MWGISSWDIYPDMQCCCVFHLICIWRTTECHLLHNVTDVCVVKYFLANTTAVLDSTAFQVILKYKPSLWFWLRQLCMLHICTWEISSHLTKCLLPTIHQMHGKETGGSAVFSKAVCTCLCSWCRKAWAFWALGNVCEGQGLRRGGFCPLQLLYLYLLSHIFLWHLSPWHVSQMTMAFFIFSSF